MGVETRFHNIAQIDPKLAILLSVDCRHVPTCPSDTQDILLVDKYWIEPSSQEMHFSPKLPLDLKSFGYRKRVHTHVLSKCINTGWLKIHCLIHVHEGLYPFWIQFFPKNQLQWTWSEQRFISPLWPFLSWPQYHYDYNIECKEVERPEICIHYTYLNGCPILMLRSTQHPSVSSLPFNYYCCSSSCP